MPNLSVRILDKLPNAAKGKRDVYHDDKVKGLSVRVTSSGYKSFIVRKKKNGKDSLTTVGHYPTMTVEQARVKARSLLSLFDSGIIPKQREQEQQTQKITLRQVYLDYVKSRGTNLKENTKKGYESAYNNYLNQWSNTPIAEITRDMVEKKHRAITKQSPTRANTVMRQLRAYFNYAMGEYEDGSGNPIFIHNPVSRLSHIKAWNREKRKQTVIKTYDLKKWYDTVMELPQHQFNNKKPNTAEVCRDLFLFILFTGLRRREASTLMWSNIDFKDHSLTIEDTKNHEAHSLPLTPFLLEVLERRKSDSPYIFQGTTPDKPLNDPKKQLEKVRQISGVYFNLHDLRRTFITIAESLDINTYALKQLLNHKDQRDVTGGYIITDMERLREPMNKITDYILEQVK
ncbi:Phage related integrase [hydrothermal vent metagenome]|uniref:Phage related integrase n=1 Tax=hydrothermal vent metagenome TaxID=652676 RepID=A0A1W1D8J0_9ZZZZ